MAITERLTAEGGALLVVDLQGKLLAAVVDRETVVDNTLRLVRGAKLLGLPVFATEQYPKGLGPSVEALADLVPDRSSKTTFHCCAAPRLVSGLHERRVRHVTLAGIEAHVCVAQSALELLTLGFVVQVAADAVGSRHRVDWEFGLRRLERAGAVVSTAEAVLFEWAERSDRPEFKAISELIKARDARPTAGTPG